MRIRPTHRVLAVLLIQLFLFDIWRPTIAYALTGGPSQPEFESFEPVSTDQMVDLFTGDFNYNIPLMTVPGPNGGYPINLAYHAGIGMEQEASWVGLGWNINAGEISRQMRGLPDDFDGDQVVRTLKVKDDVTASLSLDLPIMNAELFGAPVSLSAGGTVYYNSYRGVGKRTSISAGAGFGTIINDHAGDEMALAGVDVRASLQMDSQTGLSVPASLSLRSRIKHIVQNEVGIRGTWSSRGGWDQVRAYDEYGLKRGISRLTPTGSTGMDFSYPSSTPAPFAKTKGTEFGASFEYGNGVGGLFTPNFTVRADVSVQKIQDETRTLSAYGFIHSEDRTGQETGLMDFDRENNVPITKYIHNAPIPSFTYDPFAIKGQGIGGTFRAYRPNMGLVCDEALNTTSTSYEAGGEIAPGAGPHFGLDLAEGTTNSYSGPWTSGNESMISSSGTDFRYGGRDSYYPLYEPSYLRSTAELTATPLTRWADIGGEDPVRFELGQSDNGDYRGAAFARNALAPSTVLSNDHSKARERRSQLITYRTNNEILQDPAHLHAPHHLYEDAQDPLDPAAGGVIPYSSRPAAHIGEITVTNTDGSRYIYGLAAYNQDQKEVVAAMSRSDAQDHQDRYPGRVGMGLDSGDPAIHLGDLPGQSQDKFYSSTELPAYSHSHLLTAIYSPDYVDLTNNGPTKDDLGYYVKFNYTTGNTPIFQWRMPYKGYHYQKGAYSNDDDDRVAYSYGAKEIYYLHSIETKTHIAYFRLNDPTTEARLDAHAASGEENSNAIGATSSRYLKRIELYSKDQPTHVLKSVELGYDPAYPLCRGIDNGTSGKLTLKSVRFKNLESDRGSLSPYVFDYGDLNDLNTNPNYDYLASDRWGNYKPIPTDWHYTNSELPYVDQHASSAERNAWASAWCLRKIGLPSGGEINVNYESDDYAYVQDRPAMQMCKIVDTGHLEQDNSSSDIKKNDLRIYFEMDDPNDDPRDYVGGLSRVYFKAWVDLKKRKDIPGEALEYIEGYARVDHNAQIGTENGWGFFSVLPEHYGHMDFPVHPIRFAAWQYLKYKRPDLFQSINLGNGSSVSVAATSLLNELLIPIPPVDDCSFLSLLTGYYNMADIKGFAKHIQLEDDPIKGLVGKPSYVRLFDKGDMRKYGGGHRVASITISDNWTDGGTRTYGKKYTYECVGEKDINHNGTIEQNGQENAFHYSSGVAAYEPIPGGDENALHRPVYYDQGDQELTLNDDHFYLEEPFNESYYPAPVVGYSRVVVSDISPDPHATEVTRNGNGVTVHEFYTSKDFPVISKQTGLEKKHYGNWIPIPLFGSKEYNNNGYSQGYSIEINDMHGQVKSIAQYRNTDDLTGRPVRRTTYFYHTDPSDPHRLNNQVDVLTGDMSVERSYLGQTIECFTDMDEHGTVTDKKGHHFNLDVLPIMPIPSWYPVTEHVESLYRALVTNKIIEKHGIIERVVVEDEGAVTEQRNLAYDAATGAPLLTSVTNSFDDPIYTYTYAAHNIYPGMDAAYTNVGATFPTTNIVNGQASVTNADHYFYPGDEVEVWNANCEPDICAVLYVQSVSSSQVHFEAANGTTPTLSGKLRIRRSGHRNLLAATCGQIVSLNNPVAQTNLGWISLFDQYIAGNPAIPPATTPINVPIAATNCSTGANYVIQGSAVVQPGNTHLNIGFDGFPCSFQLLIPSISGAPELMHSMSDIHIDGYNGISSVPPSSYGITDVWPEVMITIGGVQYQTWCRSEDLSGCLQACMRTLHADALRMRDDWTYDYADLGDPVGESGSLASHAGNDYRYGRKGVWRPWSNYLYQVDRLKGDADRTNIQKDGEYATFQPFNFNDPAAGDPHWHQRDEMLRYSPYGFALESKDAVGNHSAQLYGYDNSQVTASAVNANYFEIAAEGFEDHPANYTPGHGHLALSMPGGATLGAPGHTGKKCLYVQHDAALLNTTVDDPAPTTWSPLHGERYTVSAWFYGASDPRIRLFNAQSNATIAPAVVHNDGLVLDGWRKVDIEFIAPSAGAHLGIAFEDEQGTPFWIDDIRLHPTDATMSTFVYDRGLFWLNATLDDRNYATFYNYDEEGVLTQVKKETERGIQTLRTTRQNVAQ